MANVPLPGSARHERASRPARGRALVLNPEFCLTYDEDGAAVLFVLEDLSESQRLSEQERLMLACFSAAVATPRKLAITRFVRLAGGRSTPSQRARAAGLIDELSRRNVLVERAPWRSIYDGAMAEAYQRRRRVPPEVAALLVRTARIGAETRVLDVGAGPGSLALALASYSGHVTALDASEHMLARARAEASKTGAHLRLLRGSANRLVFHGQRYDVVTICQTFHWLAPALAAQGVGRVLAEGGRLFMIESKYALSAQHPLRFVLGLGATPVSSIPQDCLEHATRYEAALAASGRQQPLRLTGLWLFGQACLYDSDFMRAFFGTSRLEEILGSPEPWAVLESMLSRCPPQTLVGQIFWFVAAYERSEHTHRIEPPQVTWIDGSV